MLARKAFYHLIHTPVLFPLVIFQIRFLVSV
jgi:hypothetical protein